MRNKDTFSSYHPCITFLYFILLFWSSLCIKMPVCVLVFAVCGVTYFCHLRKDADKILARLAAPLFIAWMIIGPSFNHQGMTIIAYLESGNPITLESILCSLYEAALMVGILMWFLCFTEITTSDKFVYIFGKISPVLGLVLSMILRFIPKFKAQLKIVKEGRESLGFGTESGNILRDIKNAFSIFGIMASWSLDSFMLAADSMKSRGYGLPNRSAYSLYIMDQRDKNLMAAIIASGAYVLSGFYTKALYFRFYPSIKYALASPLVISFQIIYVAFCMLPILIDRKEEKKWKQLRSNI